MEKIKKKVLITGISGMLGADLFRVFEDRFDVYGADLRTAPYLPPDRFFNCDITDKNAVAGVLDGISPWLVIHSAAYTNVDGCESAPEQCRKVNVLSTEYIADHCRQNSTPLLFISTDYVFDGRKNAPYAESDQPSPLNVYGDSKLKAEELIRSRIDKHLIVRTSWLFGRNGNNFVRTIINKARETGRLEVVDDQVGAPTYTLDLAGALSALVRTVLCEEGGQFGTYHVSNSGRCSWCGFAREIVKQKNIPAEVVAVATEKINRPAKRPAFSLLNTEKYNNTCSEKLRAWPEALRAYLAESD